MSVLWILRFKNIIHVVLTAEIHEFDDDSFESSDDEDDTGDSEDDE